MRPAHAAALSIARSPRHEAEVSKHLHVSIAVQPGLCDRTDGLRTGCSLMVLRMPKPAVGAPG